MLARLNVGTSALILLPEANPNIEISARNLAYVKTLRATFLSVRDLLRYDTIIMPREAVQVVQEMLGVAN
jgi:large subunit ribosomal protein L4